MLFFIILICFYLSSYQLVKPVPVFTIKEYNLITSNFTVDIEFTLINSFILFISYFTAPTLYHWYIYLSIVCIYCTYLHDVVFKSYSKLIRWSMHLNVWRLEYIYSVYVHSKVVSKIVTPRSCEGYLTCLLRLLLVDNVF